MSKLIRKKNSNSKKVSKKGPIVDLKVASKLKSTGVVSNIVQQLSDQGYNGDIFSQPDLGATRISSDISDNIPNVYDEEQMVGDIDFDDSLVEEEIETIDKQVELSPTEKRRKHQNLVENRTENSKKQIDDVTKKAKKLYSDIDGFINGLRDAANNAPDNQYLCRKFEGIRRLCIGFVHSMQSQLPRLPASLFVNVEENINE